MVRTDVHVLSSRVLLRPSDLDRSVTFYADVVGLHVYREYGDGANRGVVFFLGGGFLELSGAGGGRTSDDVGLWLQVPDAAAAEAHLRDHAVVIDQPARTMPWGLVELYARDPDGLRLVFVEVPADHPLRRRQ